MDSNNPIDVARDKLSTAVQNLMIHAPWFANIVLRLDFQATCLVPAFSTNGKYLFFNHEYVNTLTNPEICYILIHEVLHIVLLHTMRLGNRDPQLANVAMDYAINPLITENLIPGIIEEPEGALIDPRFVENDWDRDRTTMITKTLEFEKIYDILEQERPEQPSESGGDEQESKSGSGSGGGSDDKSDGKSDKSGNGSGDASDQDSDEDPEDMISEDPFGGVTQCDESEVQEIREAIQSANFAANQRGTGSSSIDAALEEVQCPRKDWRDFIDETITTAFNARDYDRRSFNRRLLPCPVFAPAQRGAGLDHAVIVYDSSGSVSDNIMQNAWQHTKGLLEQFDTRRVTIIHNDWSIQLIEEFTGQDLPEKLQRVCSGGTRFTNAFAHVDDEGWRPDVLIYFTDLECGEYPDTPQYPVIWATEAEPGSYWYADAEKNAPGIVINVND